MQQKQSIALYSKVFNRNSLHIIRCLLFMDFQDVAHASELHNSTSTTDTASNPQSFEKKVNNSTHEDVQNAASPSQSIP